MKDTILIRLKAQMMSPEQLVAELGRIDRAMAREDTLPREVKRYQVRRQIMAAELVGRVGTDAKGGAQ